MVSVTRASFEDDTTVIRANQFPVKSVKLFGSGSAEVTRTFSLSFLRPQDTPQIVEIVHLPANLQSVNVSVSRNLTILDHYHATQRSSVPSSQTLQELQAEEQRLEDEKRLRQQSLAFLTAYMDSLAQDKGHHQSEAAQMVSFFDDFVETGIARFAVIAELDGKLAEVGNKIADETQLDSDLPVKFVAVLVYNGQLPVEDPELTLTYAVNQVSWKPEYNLHISTTGDTPSPIAKLDFRCSVTQWTGENWEDVSLALTTGDQISQLIQLPDPKRIDISLSPTPISAPANESVQPSQKLFHPPPSFRPPTLNFDRNPSGGVHICVDHQGLREAQRRYGLLGAQTQSVLKEHASKGSDICLNSTHEYTHERVLTVTTEATSSPALR